MGFFRGFQDLFDHFLNRKSENLKLSRSTQQKVKKAYVNYRQKALSLILRDGKAKSQVEINSELDVLLKKGLDEIIDKVIFAYGSEVRRSVPTEEKRIYVAQLKKLIDDLEKDLREKAQAT